MTRFTTLSRQFGVLVFALMFALSLVALQMAHAAPPVSYPINPSVIVDNTTYAAYRNTPYLAVDAIYNIKISVPKYNKSTVTATISFDTFGSARAMINWGPLCWNSICDSILPADFDGYDEKGYTVKHSTGNLRGPAGSTLTHHVFTLTGLNSDTGYEFFISVDLSDGHVHWFYGRFQSGELIIA
jgi:hypothetical protein